MKKIAIFDSTLRDGAQGIGISFSGDDKLNIIRVLDNLGIAYIEAGNPHSSAAEAEFFAKLTKVKLKNSKIVAFGSTRRKNIDCKDDKNLQTLLAANTSAVAIFGKSSCLHVSEVIKTTLDENLKMIEESVRFLKEHGREVIYDAEHFFDGYVLNADYALKTLAAAVSGGADQICLCDTNGGMFPNQTAQIFEVAKKTFPNAEFSIHCHNDSGLAVANSIAAVEQGAISVQGTFLGFGERCGNANLSTIIANLQLKAGYNCIPLKNLPLLYESAVKIAEISNISIEKNQPYIGAAAFAHKAGMHADGVLKVSSSFEHIDPELIGNKRRLLLSEMSGKSAVYSIIKDYFPELDKNSADMDSIIAELKRLAILGYQFEAAEASFALRAHKLLKEFQPPFELINLKTISEQPVIDGAYASAILKIKVNGQTRITASDGEGPVNALDLSLRRALADFYPQIEKVSLKDYKVRVIDSERATGARTRVLITSTDGESIWTTVGVSVDIIQASWIALCDSIEYYLMLKNKLS